MVFVEQTGKQRDNNCVMTNYGAPVCLNSFQSGIMSALKRGISYGAKCFVISVGGSEDFFLSAVSGEHNRQLEQKQCAAHNRIVLNILCLLCVGTSVISFSSI